MLWRRFLLALIFLCCLPFAALLFWKNFVDAPVLVSHDVIFYVKPNSSVFTVAQSLESQGIISHAQLFMLLAKLEGDLHHLKVGEYKVNPGMTSKELLAELVNGKVYLRKYTLVEGWNFKKVVLALDKNPYLLHTIHKTALADIAKKIGATQENFEGYFYPDTYLFAAGVDDLVILKQAYRSMHNALQKAWQNRAANLPYQNPYIALIVASLIEKETAQSKERAKIAGVILRRLQKNMRLQIDASVIYGLGDAYKNTLTKEDLKKDTPYNTYLHEGLPPTPIAMPSMPSIIAALHPKPGTSLYYVARGDGYHEFTDTLQDHHEAVRKYHRSS